MKQFTFYQKIKFSFVIILFFLILLFGLAELVLRSNSIENNYDNKAEISEEFGWMPKSNYSATYEVSNIKELAPKYTVDYTTDKNGFRIWGDPSSDKTKVLFIGDSYTQSVESNEDKLFYTYVADSLGLEVFAFGQAGFGTLQQMLVVKKHLAEIKPDLIVWQSCDNDFLDNHPELEYNAKYTVGLRRPYYTASGDLYYQLPIPKWHAIANKSKLATIIKDKIVNATRDEDKWSEKMISRQKDNYPVYKESKLITSQILKDFKASVDCPIIGFSASSYEPQLSDMKKLALDNKIPFYDHFGKEMDKFRHKPTPYFSVDSYHWNEAGQVEIGKMLIPIVEEHLKLKN